MMRKILIIDDDPVSNYLVIRILRKHDLSDKTVVKVNGKEGIDYLLECLIQEEDFPEIIFLDIDMPVQNGFEFLEEFNEKLKRTERETNIVALSSDLNEEVVCELKILGVKYFIEKPLKINSLMSLLEKIREPNYVPYFAGH